MGRIRGGAVIGLALVGLIALFDLVAHVAGLDHPGVAKLGYAPMSPAGALSVLLLAAGAALALRQARAVWHRVGLGISGLVAVVGGMDVAGDWLEVDLQVRHALDAMTGHRDTAPGTRLSPATGLGLLASGLAVAALHLRRLRDRWRRPLGVAIGIVVTSVAVVSATLLLGHIYGTPVQIGADRIPIGVTSALALLLLSIAILLVVGTEAPPLSAFVGDDTRARLLRAFLPLVVLAVIAKGLWAHLARARYQINDALLLAVSTVIIAAITGLVVSRVARTVGTSLDRAHRQRQRAEKERAAMEVQLLQAAKMESVGRLAGGVAHDFNNILTVFLSVSALMRASLVRGGADLKTLGEHLDNLDDCARRASDLTRQLLVFSRRQPDLTEIIDASAQIERAQKMLRRLIRDDIALITELGPEPLWVEMAPGQLDQVLVNLVVNASDAMTGGGTLRVTTGIAEGGTVAADAERAAGEVVIRVADTGCGMDERTRQLIFDPFFTTKDVGRGTGLGLAMVYAIVDKAGGHIRVDSRPGEGTTFEIRLPLACAEGAREGDPAVAGRAEQQDGGATVLVCDDDAAVLRTTSRLLAASGYHVLSAGSGAAALEQAARHHGKIDLLITDVVMPEMNGRELAEACAARHDVSRVLFISGYAADAIEGEPILESGSELLEKPFTPKQLLDRVRSLLDNGEALVSA